MKIIEDILRKYGSTVRQKHVKMMVENTHNIADAFKTFSTRMRERV